MESDDTAKQQLKPMLDMATQQNWHELVKAINKILAGQRSEDLLAGLDDEDQIIIKSILLGLQKAGITKRRRGDSVKVMKWVKDNAPSKDYEIIAGKVYQSLLALEKKGYSFPFFISQNQKDTGGFRGRAYSDIEYF